MTFRAPLTPHSPTGLAFPARTGGEGLRLMRELEPMLVSEHLSWGSVDGRFTNDLLPLPYTEEALLHMVSRVRQVQDFLGRQILIGHRRDASATERTLS